MKCLLHSVIMTTLFVRFTFLSDLNHVDIVLGSFLDYKQEAIRFAGVRLFTLMVGNVIETQVLERRPTCTSCRRRRSTSWWRRLIEQRVGRRIFSRFTQIRLITNLHRNSTLVTSSAINIERTHGRFCLMKSRRCFNLSTRQLSVDLGTIPSTPPERCDVKRLTACRMLR
jgi:hypothetical protein